tara:strand:- start:534 stop:1892 length:1359 start_codon:yes stop_codon:yes gene_type:complete
MKKENTINKFFYPLLSVLSLSAIFFYKKPFWGIMDDPTSIQLSKIFYKNPIETTLFWISQNTSHGMFRPFFALQQSIQYIFYDINNPIYTYILNIFISIFALVMFSSLFIRRRYISIFLSIIFLWPYSYDLFLMPTLNEKWGILILYFGLKTSYRKKVNYVFKLFFGVTSILIKLNVFIFFPLVLFYELTKNKKFYLSFGMVSGLIIQLLTFIRFPNSYYNEGLSESLKIINFFTFQNIFLYLIFLLIFLILFLSKNFEPNDNLFLLCIFSSLFIAYVIINLRNSEFSYLGSVLSIPLAIFIIFIFDRYINIDKYHLAIYLLSIILGFNIFLTKRLERWSDIEVVLNYETSSEVLYFCSEGTAMLNILDYEINNSESSFIEGSLPLYDWYKENLNNFKYLNYEEAYPDKNTIFVLDPWCENSINHLEDLNTNNCDYSVLYERSFKLINKVNC